MLIRILSVFSVIIFYSPANFALGFAKVNGQIFIAAKTCNEISDQLPEIAKWQALNKPRDCKPVFQQTVAGFCRANITNCLPQNAVNLFDQKADRLGPNDTGPNCHGLSAYELGLTSEHVETAGPVLLKYLNSKFCKKMSSSWNSEKLQPGDIGMILTVGEPLHSFVHVSKGVVWTKNGYSIESVPKLSPVENVISTYFKKQIFMDGPCKWDCGGVKPGDPKYELCQKNEVCNSMPTIGFYRCENFDTVLKSAPLNIKNLWNKSFKNDHQLARSYYSSLPRLSSSQNHEKSVPKSSERNKNFLLDLLNAKESQDRF